jgi:beta-N-acetylhexosaminidase
MRVIRAKGFLLLLLAASLTSSTAYTAGPQRENRSGRDNALHLDHNGEKWAAKTLRKLSLEEKIGQMLMVWAPIQFMNVNGPDYLELRDTIEKYHVGGFGVTALNDGPFLLKNQPLEAAALTNQLQKDSKYPLIFAADFECGLSMRIDGTTVFPHAMAFGAAGDKDLAFEYGRIVARESRAIGVHWNWFPVADVNSNPANPIINTRSFGEDPKQVSDMVTAYIAGARSEGMLTTVKHFPGHGDTDTDSHLTVARVNGDRKRLDAVELVPFRAAIAAGVDSVMVGHVTVPAIEPDPNRPASISFNVVTGLLKNELGFRGLVVSDGMAMGALTNMFSGSSFEISKKSAVEAVKAGDDLILVPPDVGGAYQGILEAVRQGDISETRIDESVLKILRMKASLGLHHARLIDLEAVTREIARPENVAIAQKVGDNAITLVRDNNQVLPLKANPPTLVQSQVSVLPQLGVPEKRSETAVIVLTDDVGSADAGKLFGSQIRLRLPDATVLYVDDRSAETLTDQVMITVENARKVIVVAEAFPGGGRKMHKGGGDTGSAGLDQGSEDLLNQIVRAAGRKTAVIALGNPYIISSVPQVQTYLCTFSNTPTSARSAVRALFGEIPIRGHIPVTIPSVTQSGAGLERAPVASGTVAPIN